MKSAKIFSWFQLQLRSDAVNGFDLCKRQVLLKLDLSIQCLASFHCILFRNVEGEPIFNTDFKVGTTDETSP